MLLAAKSSIYISNSLIDYNHAQYCGGVFVTVFTKLALEQSDFSQNMANGTGGVILSVQDSYIINCSKFVSNNALYKVGVMESHGSSFIITDSLFSENSAEISIGVVLLLAQSLLRVAGSNFSHNSAGDKIGVVKIFDQSDLFVNDCIFVHNTAATFDSCLYCSKGYVSIYNSLFEYNEAYQHRMIFFVDCLDIYVTGTAFQHNLGSLYSSNTNLFFHDTVIHNCSDLSSWTHRNETSYNHSNISTILEFEGGAITSWNSEVDFTGAISLLGNTAQSGGAILAMNSIIMFNGEITIANNTATSGNGGGILMQGCTLYVEGKCLLSNNQAAEDGGGILYLSDSTVDILTDSSTVNLYVSSNRAKRGRGMYFDANSRITLDYSYNSDPFITIGNTTLFLTNNSALYGGAVFVNDDTNSYYTCHLTNECFIRVLPYDYPTYAIISNATIKFEGNTASPMKQGADIFGGFIDDCTLVPLLKTQFLRLTYGQSMSEFITGIESVAEFSMDSISSHPVRLCFCTNDDTTSKADCSYQPPTIFVKKGEKFTVSVVALDQVNHFVDANVHVSPSSLEAGFAEGQQTQPVRSKCTELQFNVFSPHNHEKISLHADGSCTDSILHLHVKFKNCTCPIGLEPCQSKRTVCECFCDPKLSPYVTSCNATTGSMLLKEQSKAWIMYYNDEVQAPGYVIVLSIIAFLQP